MSEVTNRQNYQLLRNLKDFAFEGNTDFRHGLVDSVRTQKEYMFDKHIDLTTDSMQHKILALGFLAFRHHEIHAKNKPGYSYEIFCSSERTISEVPLYIFDKMEEEEQEAIAEIDADSLTESICTTYSISNYEEPGPIETDLSYAIRQCDEEVYSKSSTEIIYNSQADSSLVTIPMAESDFGSTKLYIPNHIEHESIDELGDRVINELAFRAIINPFDMDDTTLNNFDIASSRMRAIVAVMQHGVGVRQIYDL